MSRIIGTYQYPSYANKGKIQKVEQVINEYRKTAKNIAKLQWTYFFKNGSFNKTLSIKHLNSKLSERYKQNCQRQVVGTLESFIENVKREFEKIVYKSRLDKKTKQVLLSINKQNKWLDNTIEKVYWISKEGAVEHLVSEEEKLIAKKIFKHILSKWRKPKFNKIAMNLDSRVVKVEENKHSKLFNKWLKLSTLEKKNPIHIPLKNNLYAENQDGKFLNFYQINIRENRLDIRLIKELNPKEYHPQTEYIAIDLGLTPLMATNKGDLIGRNFLDFLKHFDEKITKRFSYLQKKKIKPSQDKKYRKLVKKLQNFLKNEINRYVNNLVEIYKPETIVVEKLDFRNTELSKRLNRLVNNFGKRIFREKLKRLQEFYKIKIIEVNPAYTSQTCSRCGYVDKRNRKNSQIFKCKACGYKTNAQVNGAINILGRRSAKDIKLHTPKKAVLKILVKQYLERFKGCRSAPLEVLKENPYFRDFLEDFLNPWSVEKGL
ncbi:IS607 family transposase ISCARN1 [Thermus phage YS40_Isch]|nr:IS607 family transposase ISCARN1 [Thermus phage YS40_Isch]